MIFEGSSEIMHLFMAREAVDKHLQVAGRAHRSQGARGQEARPAPAGGRLLRGPGTRGSGSAGWSRRGTASSGELARHLRFVERASRKLARAIFHGMVVFGAKAERKQAFLFRLVDIANELFAMAASVSRAQALRRAGRPEAAACTRMADHFCRRSRRTVAALFEALWRNDDASAYALGREVLDGGHAWLEAGAAGLGLTVEDLRPRAPGRPAPAPAPRRRPGPSARPSRWRRSIIGESRDGPRTRRGGRTSSAPAATRPGPPARRSRAAPTCMRSRCGCSRRPGTGSISPARWTTWSARLTRCISTRDRCAFQRARWRNAERRKVAPSSRFMRAEQVEVERRGHAARRSS